MQISFSEVMTWASDSCPFKKPTHRFVTIALALNYYQGGPLNDDVLSKVMLTTGYTERRVVSILNEVIPVYREAMLEITRQNNSRTPIRARFTTNETVRRRLSGKVRTQVISEADGKCFWCKRTASALEIDHVVPLARGGSNSKGNLVACCRPCNSAKGTKLAHEWVKA